MNPSENLPDIDAFIALDEPQRRELLVRFMSSGLSNEDQTSWIEHCGALLKECLKLGERLYPFRSAVGSIAWLARSNSYSLPKIPNTQDWSEEKHLLLLYYYGERLRYDFNFKGIQELLSAKSYQSETLRRDGVLAALQTFAALGLGNSDGQDLWNKTRKDVSNTPQADERVSSILLHAMWFGTKIERRPQLLLELAGEILRSGYKHHSVYFRQASAFRALLRFQEALQSIDTAIQNLVPGEPGFLTVHQDYTRERDLIVSAEQVEKSANRLMREAERQIALKLENAQQIVSDSLIKLVEILGLFIAIAGVFLSAGSIFRQELPSSEKILLFSYLLAGIMGFFLLLRFVVGFRRHKN